MTSPLVRHRRWQLRLWHVYVVVEFRLLQLPYLRQLSSLPCRWRCPRLVVWKVLASSLDAAVAVLLMKMLRCRTRLVRLGCLLGPTPLVVLEVLLLVPWLLGVHRHVDELRHVVVLQRQAWAPSPIGSLLGGNCVQLHT